MYWLPNQGRGLLTVALIFVALFGVVIEHAHAGAICEALAIRDVPAIENDSSIIRKGDADTAITVYRVNKRTGRTSFCSHGGYCYPTHIAVGGDLLEALKLTNCRVADKADQSFSGDESINYELVVIRSKIPLAQLKYDDLDNRLVKLGLCSACADNVAQYYLEQPSSTCAKVAKAALEGNPDALQTLRDFPPYCEWRDTSRK